MRWRPNRLAGMWSAGRGRLGVLEPAMVAGLLLLVAGLLRPWLQVPLLSSRSPFELPVRAPGLPSQLSLSYGVLLALCALAAGAGSPRPRARASAIAAAAGAVGAVLCIMAFAQIAIWDITTR